MGRTSSEPSGSLRALIAEALRAYELAQATRLHAEGASTDTYRARLSQAEGVRDAEMGRLDAQRRQVLLVAGAEQERGGALLASIEAVDQAARALLEKAGLAHIAGAPLQVEEAAAPIRRPDEVVAAAFGAAQLAHADLRLSLLRLARSLAAAEDWAAAQRVIGPLLLDMRGPLFEEARALQCEIHYQNAVLSLAAADWAAARQDLLAALQIDQRFRDAQSLLRATYLQAARQAGDAGRWDRAKEQLAHWLREHTDDTDVRGLLVEAYERLIESALGQRRLDEAADHIRALQVLDAGRPQVSLLLSRYPSLRWSGAVEAVGENEWSDDAVVCVAVAPNRQVLAAGGSDKRVKVWEITTGRLRHNLWEHFKDVTAVAFSPDGGWLVSGSEDRTITIWEWPSGSLARKLKGHRGTVLGVAVSPDGAWIASTSDDHTVRLWELATGKLRFTFDEHMGAVTCAAFSPNGQILASGSEDHSAKLWDLASGRLHTSVEGHSSAVTCLAFSPDGHWLATGGADAVVRLWDTATGRPRQTLGGHDGALTGLAFAPDGQLLASAGADSTLRLWDPATSKLRHTLEGHGSPISSVVFSPDGQTLATASIDVIVQQWSPHW